MGSVRQLAQPVRLSRRQGANRGFDWGAFTVSAFADGAVLRNVKDPQPNRSIYSLGGSLAWTPSDAVTARVTYGYALKDVEANAVNVRRNNAHFVAVDPGKISIFGFERKNVDTVGKNMH